MQPRRNERSLNLVVSTYVGLAAISLCDETSLALLLFIPPLTILNALIPEVSEGLVRNTLVAGVLPVAAATSVGSAVIGAAVSAGTYLLLKKTGMFPADQRDPVARQQEAPGLFS